MLTRRFLSKSLINNQVWKTLSVQPTRFLTTQAPEQATPEKTPEKYGAFRNPPTSLGVKDPPVVDHNTWLQRKKQNFKDLTNYEKAFAAHAEERRYLVQEATKSYFEDVREMDRHGGKMYYASSQLLKPDKTGYMPNFEAQDLFGKKINTTEKLVNKISLMTFVYAKYGETHANTFIKPFLEKYKDDKEVQLVEVNVQENMLKQLVLKAYVPSLRRNLPEERKENYCLLYKNIGRVRRSLDMTNTVIGYAFLVDEDCKVRWTAHGQATPEEVGNMLAMTNYLKSKKK